MPDDHAAPSPPHQGAAALAHYTGPSHGRVTWLQPGTTDIYLDAARVIHGVEAGGGVGLGVLIARLHPAGDTYEVEARDDQPVWVNKERITAKRLKHGDTIEFGENGPLSHFRLYDEEKPDKKTAAEILADGVDYLKVSRRPFVLRIFKVAFQLLARLSSETTLLFRIATVGAILVLGALIYQQTQLNALLQAQIAQDAQRIEGFQAALARARDEALTPADLVDLQDDFSLRLKSNVERLKALEARSGATSRVVKQAAPAVAFLQGAYTYRQVATGQLLRYVTGPDGRPLLSPQGRPVITVGGDGPVAERQYTGTGFAVAGTAILVTNRHVALPWEDDANADAMAGRGMEPEMIKLIAYLPGRAEALPVQLVKASDDADLAVLKFTGSAPALPGLALAMGPPAPGDEVVVMGYPTGLRSMLAQSGEAFVAELQKSETTEFWSVAERLAQVSQIAPLASRGIVGQASRATIVYDAETTHGGSGGPVLGVDGTVVAVNAAILPEYGGSNLGVPVAKVRELFRAAGIE